MKSTVEMVPEGQELEDHHVQLRWLCQVENITTVGWLKKIQTFMISGACPETSLALQDIHCWLSCPPSLD